MSRATAGPTTDDAPTLSVAADDGPALPAQEIVTGRGLVAGTSGAGKSNTATVVAEELLDLGIPLAVLDPEGEFVALSEDYPVVVFGGDHDADVSGDTADARTLARRAVAERVPVVFDLSGFAEDDTHAVAGAVADGLFFAETRHEIPFLLIADELDEYLPNNEKTDATKPLSRVAQRGRKRGLGFLGVSQRPADISKDFVTQAEYHVWHRLKWDNDIDTAKDHLSADYGDDLDALDDGEVVLGADWENHPRRFYVRFKTVTDLGATPSIERSLGSVPDEAPTDLLDADDDSDDGSDGDSDALESCDECPFCRAGVEPPAHVADAVTADDGDVLGVYKVRSTYDNSQRIQIDGATFLRDLGLEAGDTVAVTPRDGEVVLDLDGDGLVTHQIGEGPRYLRLILNGRALDFLAAEPGDHVRVVERADRIVFERVTGRSDAIDYPVLARVEPYCGKGDDDLANQACLPTAVTQYLGVEDRIGVEQRDDGHVYLVPPDHAPDTYTVSEGCAALGTKALRPIDARDGDTLVVTPVGPDEARLTNGGERL